MQDRPPLARRSVSKADFDRAVKAAKDAGLTVTSIKFGFDGTIEVVTAAGGTVSSDELEAWRARRDARKAKEGRPPSHGQ